MRSSTRDDYSQVTGHAKAFKVSRRTLICTVFRTGSQWSSFIMGVILQFSSLAIMQQHFGQPAVDLEMRWQTSKKTVI